MGRLHRLLKIEKNELGGALVAFLFIFLLMASYLIAKPVRDRLASDFTDTEVTLLWTYTFFTSIVAIFIYNLCAARISMKHLVPGLFAFFALTFGATAAAIKMGGDPVLVGKIFYVWISVFSLFHISVFWSFMSQLYTKSQSKRLFAFINLGASAGSILGSLILIKVLSGIGLEWILVITVVTLLAVIPLIFVLNAELERRPDADDVKLKRLSGNPFTGLMAFINHPRLIGIGMFIFIYVGISSFFYLAQKNILADYSDATRDQVNAGLDLATNITTILLGLFVANRLAGRFGMAFSMGIIPLVVVGALVLFATTPTVTMLIVLQVLRKAGNYSITRPSKEILFTGVDSEARFKAKPFIDVVIYRGGDVFWGWFFVMLGSEGLSLFGLEVSFGLSLSQKLLVGAGIATVWMTVAIIVGLIHDRGEEEE